MTTGGTGLTPRDVTPQATRDAIDYDVPGLAEAMRAAGRAITPLADLSRGVVGVVGRALVVNLPGSPRARSSRWPRSSRSSTTRSRHWPDRSTTMRPSLPVTLFGPFADVPYYPLVFPLF